MFAVLLIASLLGADASLVNPRTHISSHSGQFLVQGEASKLPPPVAVGTNAPVYLSLDPQLLAITAERVKEAFLGELRQPDRFADKIYLHLAAQLRPETPVGIMSKLYSDGWQYHVQLPAVIEQGRLVKGLLQATLSEFANRHHRRAAELPTWLVEGLHQRIAHSAIPTHFVKREYLTYEVRGLDRLKEARAFLSTNSVLTFHELSFPATDFNNPAQASLFQNCAHLFVSELLQFKDGSALLTAFIQRLPTTLNWQTAFLQVYSSHFRTLLEVEKWWALTCVDFRGREGKTSWPVDTSIQKLQALLLTPLDLKPEPGSLATRREVSIQELIANVDVSVQKEILSRKIRDLNYLAYQVAAPVVPVVLNYRAVLQQYLEERELARVQPSLRQDPEQRLKLLLKQTAVKLEELDRQLIQLPTPANTTVLRKNP